MIRKSKEKHRTASFEVELVEAAGVVVVDVVAIVVDGDESCVVDVCFDGVVVVVVVIVGTFVGDAVSCARSIDVVVVVAAATVVDGATLIGDVVS